ncbi:hypothetical protein KSF_109000 [Reticulibacter mediterranei]|uniref:Phosphoadenosine phosphosulphate reductase domain-containing protein n=1 Tax=Reticulibacter mediterranei TaxID=2778369 RepID=A0A8J3N6X7_9CHLR|nr:phosphoadenosine phosphosulfate reductase family protein [Reticulibacter mediterranei]GHP00853.1 hypothetical protein KSF_109000 [Reticulibacter mediterranei]
MTWPTLAVDETVADLTRRHAPVAACLSGGIDGATAAAYAFSNLRANGYQGPFIGIHSDLGRVEHTDSQPQCQRLCDQLGIELVVVRRQSGDMMDRWLQRWRDNVNRYSQLLCVKLVLPWSTASMRFCTSELKTAIICRELVQRFPGQTILQILGIRWDESPDRAKAPICTPQPKLFSKTLGTNGYSWNPILAWEKEQCFEYHRAHGLSIHEAYRHGMSRISCIFCILAKLSDLVAATANSAYHDLYREMVMLEIISTFSFQSKRWLGDIAEHLLTDEMRWGLAEAKRKATLREAVEKRIPKHLHYTRHWPTVMPTWEEARLLAEVRCEIAAIMGIEMSYTEPDAIRGRYSELIEEKARRDEEKQRAEARKTLSAA